MAIKLNSTTITSIKLNTTNITSVGQSQVSKTI